jgi:hypothetical protein
MGICDRINGCAYSRKSEDYICQNISNASNCNLYRKLSKLRHNYSSELSNLINAIEIKQPTQAEVEASVNANKYVSWTGKSNCPN